MPTLSIVGGLTAGATDHAMEKAELQPGATLMIPLIMGDMSAGILGTVTEVLDDEVYAFGHPWQSQGNTLWPMATGYIHTFVSRKDMSFKLGQAIEIVGAIRADEAPGVFGRIGEPVQMVPVQVKVITPTSASEETFHIEMAQDERADPILAAMTVFNTVLHRGGLPREHTIQYEVTMQFEGAEPIHFTNVSSDAGVDDVVFDILSPLALLLNNPWQKVKLAALSVRASVTDRDTLGMLKSAQLERLSFQPGQSVRAQVVLEPLRAPDKTAQISLALPEDLPDGKYKVVLGSAGAHMRRLRAAQPHLYSAFDSDDVRRILQDRLALRRDRLYISLIVPGRGLAFEGHGLVDLPTSKQMMLTDKSRSTQTARFSSVASASVETDCIVFGSETFSIEVKRR